VRPRPLSPTRSPTCSACACSRKPPARAPSSHADPDATYATRPQVPKAPRRSPQPACSETQVWACCHQLRGVHAA
jgi:hypothetical protein